MPKYAGTSRSATPRSTPQSVQARKRRALASAEADARRNLAALAEDEAARASVLEAAEAAEREARAAREDRAARERGGGGEGGGGRASTAAWTQQLRGRRAAERGRIPRRKRCSETSREVDDAVGRLDKLQLRRALKEFRLADPDDDGVLSKEEFREALAATASVPTRASSSTRCGGRLTSMPTAGST